MRKKIKQYVSMLMVMLMAILPLCSAVQKKPMPEVFRAAIYR